MIYITKDYILTRINLTDLDVLTGGVDAVLDEPEAEAIQEASTYLAYRYDVEDIFDPEQTDSAKYPLIKRIVADILIYNLNNRVNPRNIPEKRIQLRDDAIKWLSDVANPRSEVSAPFLPKAETEERKGVDISWNSRQKRENHY